MFIKVLSRSFSVNFKVISVLLFTIIMGGCYFDGSSSVNEGKVNFVLASVDGGSCTIYDAATGINPLAGPEKTSLGVATFKDLPSDTGMVLVECSGGAYKDEATGTSLTPGTLRSYTNITSSEFNATVTPLTEMATRIVQANDHDPATDYSKVLANVADAFGLKGFNLATAVPTDLNLKEADGSAGGRYGVVLAAFSQLQLDINAGNADKTIDVLMAGLANNGLFTSDEVRDLYFNALENMFDNPRIDPNLGYDVDLDALFNAVVLAPLASQVEYVDADNPVGEDEDGEAYTTIYANEASTFDIVGTHLSLDLTVTLGGLACEVYDLQSLADTNTNSKYNLMFADCPPQPAGQADLVVMDNERLENTTTMTVVEAGSAIAGKSSNEEQQSLTLQAATAPGSSKVSGTVTAEAPAIDPSISAAHDYTSANLEVFNVSGVRVVLIDQGGTVIARTTTDSEGYYEFSEVSESTAVRVVVKARLSKSRTSEGVGPQYDFSVRDNTSTTTPKKLYELTSPQITTLAEAGADNSIDIRAKIGFDDNGNVISESLRQSAPFAILRVVKSAADKLETINSNIDMPKLNLYWSGKNIGVDGDKSVGQISTSHYDSSSLLPGVYILGKADSDTDEFDQGVIGHEFGHYLQAQLAFSDSPGGSHGDNEFKDASLAFGEGYGTAVGGLLASGVNSRYYCDVSGDLQTGGFCTDLTQKVAEGNPNGFYSEATIIYLMYGVGTIPDKGFTEFFKAVTEMKSHVHSATIYPFLNNYLESNPDAANEVQTLMDDSNIKTSEPFGVYPVNTVADPAISAEENKGESTVGADDLEKLYLDLSLASVNAPNSGEAAIVITPNAPTFCLNNNLEGANSANGLGMIRRATFTSNYTGNLLIRGVNKLGQQLTDQSVYFDARDDAGANVRIYGYNGVDSDEYYGKIKVVSDKVYSLMFSVSNPEIILKGSQCGYKIELARSPD